MELSVKQCKWQRIRCQKLFAGSSIGCIFFSQLCFPSTASSLPSLQRQEAAFSMAMDVATDGETEAIEEFFEDVTDDSASSDTLNQEFAPPTSVSELSDVQPTDWAYQALRSLMERYGILSGYSDGKFRGNRPLSRYEFAAALAATLDKVDSLIVNAIGEQYIQEDLVTLRRLQRDYRSALDQLQQRIASTENRVTQLEANEFSTTTKLQGQVILALTEGSNSGASIITRERLNLLTSFNGQDILLTQLEAGNNGLDTIGQAQEKNVNLLGTSGLIANGGGLDYIEADSSLRLRRLYYTFRPVSDLAVTVGAKISPRDFIDRNTYANNEAVDFSSSFFLNNPLIVQNQMDRNGGAGAVLSWNPGSGPFTFRSLYVAADANNPNSSTDGGLFGDRYQTSVELEYAARDRFALRLQYTNAAINNTDINAFGVNAEYALNRYIGVFSRVGFGNYQGFNTAINQDLDLHSFSWAVGLGLRNLFIPGTTAGIAVGQPFVTNKLGNANQVNFETFYNLELNDNLSISPILSVVTNADNSTSNSTIWQGTLRTVIVF
ncbi:iron uptake porin [Scytonema sp. UIC 10036]|uniref:iron uptake porin n=1 Tax=Scytonema sp. UIC 10036 TaxID=2304196 RepID=UPI001A9B0A43|nr:iron uptake porin [Scytonema sp. UIC 10036]